MFDAKLAAAVLFAALFLVACEKDNSSSTNEISAKPPTVNNQLPNTPSSVETKPDETKVDYSALGAILKEQNPLDLDRDYVLTQYT